MRFITNRTVLILLLCIVYPLVSAQEPVTDGITDGFLDITTACTVVTNDPAIKHGTLAGRVKEFPAADLVMDKQLIPNEDGSYELKAYEDGRSVIGMLWMEERQIKSVEIEFADASGIPAADNIQLELWHDSSKNAQGLSKWKYSLWQGDYLPVKPQVRVDGAKMSFFIERQDGGNHKLRFIFPKAGKPVLIKAIRAYSYSQEGCTAVKLQLENRQDVKAVNIDIYNGQILNKQQTEQWDFSAPLELSLKYKSGGDCPSDKTVLRLQIDDKAFGVYVDDVLNNGAVYYEDAGVYLSKAGYELSIAEHKKQFPVKPSILDEVRRMPDQTFANAMEKVHRPAQNNSPTMLSLACDNNKFIVKKSLEIYKCGGLKKPEPEVFSVVPKFGPAQTNVTKRYLLGDWQPVVVNECALENVRYRQTSFVADFNGSPLADKPWWYSDKPLFVCRFDLENTASNPSQALLTLDFDADTFVTGDGKINIGSITKVKDGVAVECSGKLKAFVYTADSDELDIKIVDNRLVISEQLASNAAKCAVLYIPAWDVSREICSDLGQGNELLQRTQDYWNKITAGCMQVDIPEKLLADTIRASVVHCLLAARNEGEGMQVSPWISADRYGPLENEAQAIVVAFDEMGLSDFAKKAHDFFLAKYNDQGVLTTGYTLMGTAQHQNSIARHYYLTGDKDWMEQVTPTMVKACDWIISQTEKTKIQDAFGNNVYYYGLFPPGVTADWSRYRFDSKLNSRYYQGLKVSADVLAKMNDPQAKHIVEKSLEYKKNFLNAYKWSQARSPLQKYGSLGWQMYDPAIIGCFGLVGDIFNDEDAYRAWFTDSSMVVELIYRGILDAQPGPETDALLCQDEEVWFFHDGWGDYPEKETRADWFNLGGFDKLQPYYAKNTAVYAMLDDVKPFIRSYFNPIGSLLDTENLTFWEHFNSGGGWNKTHETGWFLLQTKLMLVTERGSELWLAPFVPAYWLNNGQVVEIKNAPSRFGPVSYKIVSSADDGMIEASIIPPGRSKPDSIVIRLRHPEGKLMKTVTVNGKAYKDFDTEKEFVRLRTFGNEITVKAQY